MTRKQVAARLKRARRELDECAEWIDRLAVEVELPAPKNSELVGLTEIAELTGINYETVGKRYRRGTLPAPAAVLACGPIWYRSQIEHAVKRAA